jgi:hypothetical protein
MDFFGIRLWVTMDYNAFGKRCQLNRRFAKGKNTSQNVCELCENSVNNKQLWPILYLNVNWKPGNWRSLSACFV